MVARRRWLVPAIAWAAGLLTLSARAQGTAATGHGKTVLVELFTSEGCSSCPPADALLARLDAAQFVPGVQAVVLSEHVTYWDHLGWRDPYSLAEMTRRQMRYVQEFGDNTAYTPQMVIDGATELQGGDEGSLKRAVAKAAHKEKQEIAIENARWVGSKVQFSVRGGQAAPGATLMAALAEDAQSSVSRGENAGHVLHHVAVVRTIANAGPAALDGHLLVMTVPPEANMPVNGSLRLVVYLADTKNDHVLGVAQQVLSRSGGPGEPAATPPVAH